MRTRKSTLISALFTSGLLPVVPPYDPLLVYGSIRNDLNTRPDEPEWSPLEQYTASVNGRFIEYTDILSRTKEYLSKTRAALKAEWNAYSPRYIPKHTMLYQPGLTDSSTATARAATLKLMLEGKYPSVLTHVANPGSADTTDPNVDWSKIKV